VYNKIRGLLDFLEDCEYFENQQRHLSKYYEQKFIDDINKVIQCPHCGGRAIDASEFFTCSDCDFTWT
jgi:hypothetical protein